MITICPKCGKEFETNNKRDINKLLFCSRNCVYHNKTRRALSQETKNKISKSLKRYNKNKAPVV